MKTRGSILISILIIVALLAGCGTSTPAVTTSTTAAATTAATTAAASEAATTAAATTAATTAAETTATTAAEPLKEVELNYYFPNSPQQDIQTVNDHLNELVKAKINATVKLNLVDWSTYDQKINVVLASGDPCDLLFTATWAANIYQNIAKGSFEPLDDLINQYASAVKTIVPPIFWDVVKVKGKIYAVPDFQQATPAYGVLIRKDIADKY